MACKNNEVVVHPHKHPHKYPHKLAEQVPEQALFGRIAIFLRNAKKEVNQLHHTPQKIHFLAS